MKKWARWSLILAALAIVASGAALAPVHAQGPATTPATRVYWDQNEEEDFLPSPTAAYAGQQIVPPWDTNGQMCVSPGNGGNFTVGYNPTGVEQAANTGGPNLGVFQPRKQPPVGVAIYDRHGTFTGQTLYVPGPYKLTPASAQWTSFGVVGPGVTNNGLNGGSLGFGGDIPPDAGTGNFNNNGTFTGCAFDARGNLFAVDLGTSQGQYPPADNGRLLEWFAPDYTSECIVYGPTSGGDTGTHHHVDGHGGLQQPGTMAADASGNIYFPVVSADPTTQLPQSRVLKFAETSLPATPADCPYDTSPTAGPGDQTTYHVAAPTTFIDTVQAGMPFPQGIARDPVCRCWAVSNVFFGPFAVEWFHDDGTPAPDLHVPIPSNPPTPSPIPAPPGTVQRIAPQFTPDGIAFDPQGDLFVADIHVVFDIVGTITGTSISAGPADRTGQVLKFTFVQPPVGPAVANQPTVVVGGASFPVSVTTCTTAAHQACPAPH